MCYEIDSIINKLKNNKVLIIGDAMIDCSIDCEQLGVAAEAPIMKVKEKSKKYCLGGAANVALNLKYAKQEPVLFSIVGDDENGIILKKLMEKEGLSIDGIIVEKGRKTTIKTRYFDGIYQLFRADFEDDFDLLEDTKSTIITAIENEIKKFDIVVLSDYLKGVLSFDLIKSIVDIAHKYGKKVMVDPKDSDMAKYKNCDIIKPNELELRSMMKTCDGELSVLKSSIKEMAIENNHEAVIVTRGKNGILAYKKDEGYEIIDAINTKVVDVCGAGDTAFAYLIAGIVSGISMENSLKLANFAAGVKVQNRGVCPIAYFQLYCNKKQIKFEELDCLRKIFYNKRIVFTNGCFDLLHAGHVYCLEEAKKAGDILIVGINTDESVKKLKGKERPVLDERDRIKMLEALACVDYVIKFSEDTPKKIISRLKPDVLVKGSDYKDKEIIGSDIVLNNGGEIKTIKMLNGYSTSKLIQRIRGLSNE